MLEFINNVRGPNRRFPESFRTICYCLLELQLSEKLSDKGGGWVGEGVGGGGGGGFC